MYRAQKKICQLDILSSRRYSGLRRFWKSRFTFLTICYYHIIAGCQVSSVDKFINRSGALVLITAGISPCSIQASVTWRGADAGTSRFHPSRGVGRDKPLPQKKTKRQRSDFTAYEEKTWDKICSQAHPNWQRPGRK